VISPRYLDYEVALLLAKYGKEAVINSLAQKMDMSQVDLEALLKKIDKAKPFPRRHPKAPPVDPIETVVAQYPEKAKQLHELHTRFLNRTFLANLRDVKRFFDQHSGSLGHVKSRVQSLPKLIKLLAELGTAELNTLCQTPNSAEYSSLGIISDEILRRDK
jgi:hypothetical protein